MLHLDRHSAQGVTDVGASAALTGAGIIGESKSGPLEGGPGDVLGRCGGLAMFGRRSWLVRSTHDSAVSSLCAPTRYVVVLGLEATQPALPRGTSSASPQRRCNQVQSRCRSDPPTPSTVSCPRPTRDVMEARSAGPPLEVVGPAWDMTLSCDVDHVTCRRICDSHSSKQFDNSKTP